MKGRKIIAMTMAVSFLTGCLMTGCGDDTGAKKSVPDTMAEIASGAAATVSPAAVTASPKAVSPIKTLSPDRYVHGSQGYFNLNDEGTTVLLRSQIGGTCWLFASAVCMETGTQIAHGKEIELDPMSLLDKIYGEDKEEGFFVRGVGAREYGGCASFVVMTLSNGFDGYVLDSGICPPDNKTETIQKYLKNYGAVYFAVPDGDATKKANFEGYTTINHVTDDIEDYEHSIAAVGWDDHFPKDYFFDEASQDGAWITANSQANADYYYVSYDTKPETECDRPVCMSVTDEYTYVATHDCGYDPEQSIKKKGSITTANVFHKKGTLTAVGTYSLEKDQDIKIEIYDSDFNECIFTQEGTLSEMGYQVIELTQPIDVSDYAIAITYSKGVAPVEGKGWKDVPGVEFKPVSKKGESFVKIGKKWYDTHDRDTLKKLKRKRKINNVCIKGLYS